MIYLLAVCIGLIIGCVTSRYAKQYPDLDHFIFFNFIMLYLAVIDLADINLPSRTASWIAVGYLGIILWRTLEAKYRKPKEKNIAS